MWLHWYGAVRGETAVLTGRPDARARITTARARITTARTVVTGHPVAAAQVDLSEAVRDGDRRCLIAAAEAFDGAGCLCRSARILLPGGGRQARSPAGCA